MQSISCIQQSGEGALIASTMLESSIPSNSAEQSLSQEYIISPTL